MSKKQIKVKPKQRTCAERTGFIYIITCLINGKGYVGQTIKKHVEYRWNEHVYAAFVQKSKRPLYRAMRKYGLENFTAEVVWTGPESKLNAAERKFVRQYNTFIDRGMGYNLTTGGGKHQVSKYTIRKLRRAAQIRLAEHPTWFTHLVSLMAAKAHTPQAQERRIESLNAYAENRRKAGKPYFSRRVTKLLRTLAQRPRVISEETHRRMSVSQKARCDAGKGISARICTPEMAAKRSRDTKLQWKNKRAKMLAAIGAACNEPQYREKRSQIQKNRWAAKHDEFCVSLKQGHNTPEAKQNHSNENKRRWAAGIYAHAAA